MKWNDNIHGISIVPPREFTFDECLLFLNRSDHEVLHRVVDGGVNKLLRINGVNLLIRVTFHEDVINVSFLNQPSSIDVSTREEVAMYVAEWFDLDQDIAPFYQLAKKDPMLHKITERYYGLRVMCMPDLWEALVWAITGQQINLTFAYTLKKRLVEQYGVSLPFDGDTYWLFPSVERIADLEVDELKKLQFSARKAEYIIDIARMMRDGLLSKEQFKDMEAEQIHQELVSIRGVGAWTADYVLMKCLHEPTAFPIADVGLHQALQYQLGMDQKPTIEEIKSYATHWLGWEAYAVFYLWRSLYDKAVSG